MFPELKILAYVIAALIVIGLCTVVINRSIMLKIFTGAILLFAVAALIDMYMWGYQYGHNLDEHAAIKIEGESYQPPLIGYKQLLNFLALSAPDKGGIAMLIAGVFACGALFLQWIKTRKGKNRLSKATGPATLAALIAVFVLQSCGSTEMKLVYNRDACDHCGMQLVDNRYGAMLVTQKGKEFRFDDLNCMLNFKKEKIADADIGKLLITDYSDPGKLVDARNAVYLVSEQLKSPMGANTAAFIRADSLERISALLGGAQLNWKGIEKTE